MESLLVNWLFIMLHFKGKHRLECSRTLKPIDRIFIELLLTSKSGR